MVVDGVLLLEWWMMWQVVVVVVVDYGMIDVVGLKLGVDDLTMMMVVVVMGTCEDTVHDDDDDDDGRNDDYAVFEQHFCPSSLCDDPSCLLMEEDHACPCLWNLCPWDLCQSLCP